MSRSRFASQVALGFVAVMVCISSIGTAHAAGPVIAGDTPAPPGFTIGYTFLAADEAAPSVWSSQIKADNDQPWPMASAPKKDPVPQESLLDNLNFLIALDASREPQDLGINANFGGFGAVNFGFPILEELGIGGQIGTGVNLAHAGVKVLRDVEGQRTREQWFTTAGIFQRNENWHWGVGYDLLVESYYDNFFCGQARAEIGYDITKCDEVGVFGSFGGFGDHGPILGTEVFVDPMAGASFYWRHIWESTASTRIWMGVTESHNTDIILIQDPHKTGPVINFGLEIFVPLNDYFAIYGQGNFITPSDTGTLDAYLGIAFYPDGGVRRANTNRFAPVLPVADNPTFSLNLHQ